MSYRFTEISRLHIELNENAAQVGQERCIERNLIVFFSLRLTQKRCKGLISVFMVRRELHTPHVNITQQ